MSEVQSQVYVPAITVWRYRYIGIIAVGLISLGVLCNVTFYSEFGDGASSIVYAVIGLFLDLTKVTVIGLFVIFMLSFERKMVEVGLCVATWFVLSLLSFGAAYGFLSQVNEKYESEKMQKSAIYTHHKSAVEASANNLAQLAAYSGKDLIALEGLLQEKTVLLERAKREKDNCPRNYYTNCINPAQAEIDDLKLQLSKIRADISGVESYKSAVISHNQALSDFSSLSGVGTAQFHPLFVNVGEMLGQTPNQVKGIYILLTSIVLELLGSILFYLRAKVSESFMPSIVDVTPEPTSPKVPRVKKPSVMEVKVPSTTPNLAKSLTNRK